MSLKSSIHAGLRAMQTDHSAPRIINASRKNLCRARQNFIHRAHPSRAFIPAREHSTFFWSDEIYAALAKGFHIGLRRCVLPHLAIHGRSDEHRRECGQRNFRDGISRETMCEFREDVRRRRSDEQQVGAIREIDVTGFPTTRLIKNADNHRVSRESLEGQRCDKFLRSVGHRHMDFPTALHHSTGEFRRFIGSDRPGHSENDDWR